MSDGNFWNNSVSHTYADAQAWWQVDLGASTTIDSVEIWNRTDVAPDRLSDFYVLVSDNAFVSTNLGETLAQSGVSAYHVSDYPTPNTNVAIGRSGRFVRVQLAGTNYLSLAEVKVMGQPIAAQAQNTVATTASFSTTPIKASGLGIDLTSQLEAVLA